ncbi:MAG: hypothetical protein Q9162_002202 [Coniocarpon cinnabarinum]
MTFPKNGTRLSTTEFAFCIIFILICTLFLGLRLWSRTLQKGRRPHALTVSDFVVTIGYLATVGNTTCDIVAVAIGGSGQHASNVTPQMEQNGQKALFTAAFFWLTATCALKMSILLLYIEIFQSRTPQRIAYGILTLVGLFFIGFLIAIFTQCFPFSMNWNKTEPGHCGNLTAESRAGAFINLIFDTMITIFPIPMLWRLQMPLKKRIGLIALFGLGSTADGVTITRAVLAMNPSGSDYSYTSARTNILAAMELWMGTIIACTPLIKPALARLHVIAPTASFGYGAASKPSGSRPRVYRDAPPWRSDPEAQLMAGKTCKAYSLEGKRSESGYSSAGSGTSCSATSDSDRSKSNASTLSAGRCGNESTAAWERHFSDSDRREIISRLKGMEKAIVKEPRACPD